jgi:sulfate permease, SulP family
MVLHVVRQSNQVTIKRWRQEENGDLIETDPPVQPPAHEVVVLPPYGSLFFAAAPAVESQLPVPQETFYASAVIVRVRGAHRTRHAPCGGALT